LCLRCEEFIFFAKFLNGFYPYIGTSIISSLGSSVECSGAHFIEELLSGFLIL
jgi:hypothetical protein